MSICNRLMMIGVVLVFTYPKPVFGQSLEHPVIWVTSDEREHVLALIDQYEWGASIKNQLHDQVDPKLKIHEANPETILNTIPDFARNDHENSEFQSQPLAAAHNAVLSLASKSGMLYYLTQDEKYAKLSADILQVYINEIAPRTPETTSICGFSFFDPRTTYAPFALAYDFIYNYLTQPKTSVYDLVSGVYIPFENDRAQKAIKNMVGNVLQEYGDPDQHGKLISNHPILTAPGALFGILCIEDDEERERLFDVFWEQGTAHQNAFKNTILPMFGEQGIWPESTSYSFMPIITMVLNMVDRVKPELNVTEDYYHILEGNFIFDNLRYPDRRFVRYGDSKRNKDRTGDLYRYTLDIAERKGYDKLARQAKIALKQSYAEVEGYHPKITDNIFNNYEPLQLFWGIPIPADIEGEINFQKPTVIIEHAGIALQRNYVENENEKYGLCGIIGGAHYVHSHVTGISMELYGAGYVMAPNAGLPPTVKERRIPLHEKYFRLYAGNNTVIVNGTSHGRDDGSWKSKANVWQNTALNIATKPAHLEDPKYESFSFATQYLNDEVNDAVQQRTLSVIRTSPTTGYYFDMFRSKSRQENKFHDYIYHNIGDVIKLHDDNDDLLKVVPTDRYQMDIGDVVQSPGWRFFESSRVTKPTAEAVSIRFDIEYDNRSMHMLIPAGVIREYTMAVGPPTREARNGYEEKKTQIVAIRQNGEAWDTPYVSIFEPTIGQERSVVNVEHIFNNEVIVGARVTSKVGRQEITDYIICQEDSYQTFQIPELNLSFEGHFAFIRVITQEGKSNVVIQATDN